MNVDVINKLVQESLSRYFNILSKMGYKDYNSVYKLILLIYIQELFNNKCIEFTNDDIKILNNTITCLTNSTCLIPSINTNLGSSIECLKI